LGSTPTPALPRKRERERTVVAGISKLPLQPGRRRKLFGAVPFRHVDDGLHRRGEFVDVAHIGKVSPGYAAERLRCDAIEQDDAEIADGVTSL
jgi:hypothetical protein